MAASHCQIPNPIEKILAASHCGVAYLGGMLFGWVYLKAPMPRFRLLKLPDMGGWYRQWRMQRAKKKFQVYMRKQGGRGPWVN